MPPVSFVRIMTVAVLMVLVPHVASAQRGGPPTLEDLLEDTTSKSTTTAKRSLDPPPPDRLEMPDEESIENMRALIRKAFRDDYDGVGDNPEPLILKLLNAADATTDLPKKYGLLLEAEQVAEDADLPSRVLDLIDTRIQTFDVDMIDTTLEGLERLASSAGKHRPDSLGELCQMSLATATAAMNTDRYSDADSATDLAVTFAKALATAGRARKNQKAVDEGAQRQRDATAMRATIKRRVALYEEYQTAKQSLRLNSNDRESHTVVGRYLAFEKGDWEEGLSHLARSTFDGVSGIATEEMKLKEDAIPDVSALFALAGRWWERAEEGEDAEATAIRAHAADIYASIADSIPDAVDKQLAKTRSSASTTGGLGDDSKQMGNGGKRRRLVIDFDEPDILDLFETSGSVRITKNELEIGNDRGEASWARTKDIFTYPIRVEYEVLVLPDRTYDVMPGLFWKGGDHARDGIHFHWGVYGNKKTHLFAYGQRAETKHLPIVPGRSYTIVIEIDKNRILTVRLEKFTLLRTLLPQELKLEGPVIFNGGVGHMALRRLKIEGNEVP